MTSELSLCQALLQRISTSRYRRHLDLWRRGGLAVLAGAVLIGPIDLALSACSSRGQAEQAKNAPISIEASQLAVTIENKAGLPLLEVDVAILPVGGPLEFTRFVGRMEHGEKRDVAIDTFRARDSTTFSLRVVRPKAVRVTAKDLNGKTYNVQVPWP